MDDAGASPKREPPHLPMLRFVFHVGLLGFGLVGGYAASNLIVERRYSSIASSLQGSFEMNRAELLGEIDALRNAVKFEKQRAERSFREAGQESELEAQRHKREEKALREKLSAALSESKKATEAAEEGRRKVEHAEDRRTKERRMLERKLAKAEKERDAAKIENTEGSRQIDELRSTSERHQKEALALREKLSRAEAGLSEANDALFEKSRKIEEYLIVDRQLARSKQEAATLRDQLAAVRADQGADATKQRKFLDAELRRKEERHQEEMGAKEEALIAMDEKRRNAETKLADMTREYSQLQHTLAEMSRQQPD